MSTFEDVKTILAQTLQLGERVNKLSADSGLIGAIPEFDSMAVVSVLTAIEEEFDIVVDDNEITADTFSTLGTLVAYVDQKLP